MRKISDTEKVSKINIKNISKSYKKKLILNNISLTLNSGECVGIIGANGSGKTTLLNILNGEDSHFSGTVTVNASKTSLFKDKALITKTIGYVPQENPLIDDLSAYDNLRLWYCDSPLDMKSELKSGVLKTLGIDDFLKVKVKHLSGGMKKRLSIGIALAQSPAFLVLDEPSAALDLIAKDIIHTYLSSFKASGGGICIATHDENELDLCDKIYILKNHSLYEIPKTTRGSSLIKEIMA